MKNARTRSRYLTIALTLSIACLGTMPAHTADIITEWAMVKTPPVPELKPVAVDGKTTALLILDMMKSRLRRPTALCRARWLMSRSSTTGPAPPAPWCSTAWSASGKPDPAGCDRSQAFAPTRG